MLTDVHAMAAESDVAGLEAQITPVSDINGMSTNACNFGTSIQYTHSNRLWPVSRFLDLESCTPATQGTSCNVVDLVLIVYSGSEGSISAAKGQVYDEVTKHLEAGGFLVDGIIALRIHRSVNPANLSVNDETKETPQGSSGLSTLGTATISVLAVLAVSALLVLAFRKLLAKRSTANGSDNSSRCDNSTITGTDEPAQTTILAGESPQSV
jgi:hypothetical protein